MLTTRGSDGAKACEPTARRERMAMEDFMVLDGSLIEEFFMRRSFRIYEQAVFL